MIIELPNFVSRDITARVRDAVAPFLESPDDVYGTYRDGKTVSISQIEALKPIDVELQRIFTAVQETIVARRYNPQRRSADSGYEYHKYAPGDVCHYHSDGELVDGFIRYASVVLHLNTLESGGELVFPNQNKTVKTEEGKIVVFPPYGMFGHYTTPATQPREVVVCWFIYGDVRFGGV